MALSKKEKKEIVEAKTFENKVDQEIYEDSEDKFDHDYEGMRQQRGDEGQFYPDDLWKYKKFRIEPHAQLQHAGLVDKDNVLAKLSGKVPSIEELAFVAQTIQLLDDIFYVIKPMPLFDEDGEPVFDRNGNVRTELQQMPDDSFKPIRNALAVDFKFNIVSSRSMGDDREAILDKTTHLNKGMSRKQERKQRILGFGEEKYG